LEPLLQGRCWSNAAGIKDRGAVRLTIVTGASDKGTWLPFISVDFLLQLVLNSECERLFMEVKAEQPPTLTKEEWSLVIELVEREQKELHEEIHQTDSRDYRVKLSQRLDLVSRLLKILCPDKVA
jgi:hypothetical protein